MKRKFKEYSDEYARLHQDIVGREQSLDEQLRSMSRSEMSDKAAWEDLKKEAEEYREAARQAMKSGDFDAAVKNADLAKEKFAALNTEIKEGDQILVTKGEALKVAMAGVEESGELAIDALKAQKQAAHEAAEKLKEVTLSDLAEQAGVAEGGVKNITAASEILGETLKEVLEDFGDKAALEFDKIEAWLSSPHQMVVDVVTNNQQQLATGGPVLPLATGGQVSLRSMLSGGFFPGFGGGDRRHVVAEDGEYMLDKYRVRHATLPVVRAFHAGRYDLVIEGLLKKLGADAIRRKLGGAINAVPRLPGPQMLAAGGAVGGAQVSGYHEIVLRSAGSGQAATVYAAEDEAGRLTRILREAMEGSS